MPTHTPATGLFSAQTSRRDFIKTVGLGAAALSFPSVLRASTRATADRPNILLILADDMGYSDLASYGSNVRTPNIDRLAFEGVRLSQFYNAARCCPTRASLLTGLYPHEAGMGAMVDMEGDIDPPGPYEGYLNRNCVTIAEVMKTAGYTTLMSGKWHVGESRPHWPTDRGFDHYYGLISGAANYFDIRKGKPHATRRFAIDGKEITPPNHGFYMTDAITDHAISQQNLYRGSKKPWFQYLAYTAPHYPLHALPEDIERYKNQFLDGWDAMRERRYRRQIEMGLIEKRWPLTPRDKAVPAWDSLSDEVKEKEAYKYAVYAAQIDRMDQGIGRILDNLRANGQDENTLVMFLSDNGGCAEGGVWGLDLRHNGLPPGGVNSYMSYGQSWANASNTPFRLYKKWVHEGGISTPFIARWPGRVPKGGVITNQVGHIVDLMATCCDVGGATYPETYKGKKIKPLRGLSLKTVFQGGVRQPHDTLYWEHFNNRAIRRGDWKGVTNDDGGWELYNMIEDRTEVNNLAKKNPEKLKELVAIWQKWADEVGVDPHYLQKLEARERRRRQLRRGE